MLAVTEKLQGALAVICKEDHISPLATITAIGAAVGNIFFPAETYYASATISAFDVDFRFIEKHLKPRFLILFLPKKEDRLGAVFLV